MSIHDVHRLHTLYADCVEPFKPTEVFSIEKQKSNLMIADDYISTTRRALDDTVSYLPYIAEQYKISPNMSDYILVPVSVFLSNIPNKKGHCFTITELLSFDTYIGNLKYKTAERKPTFKNHRNKDVTKSQGVILQSSMQPVPQFEGNLYKVIFLQAFDRSKDPHLGNQILSGECNAYSMGATAKTFKCSVCNKDVPGDNCGHIPRGMLNGEAFRFEAFGTDKKVGFVNAVDINFFECSALPPEGYNPGNNPANCISYGQKDEILRWNE